MKKTKQKFSDFLIRHFDVKVHPMTDICIPRLWRRFNVSGVCKRGKDIYLDDLEDMSESQLQLFLAHEIQHAVQQRGKPWSWFVFMYYANPLFRAKRETLAMKSEMEMHHIQGDNIFLYPAYCYKVLRSSYLIGRKRARKSRASLESHAEFLMEGNPGAMTELYNRWNAAT